MTALGAEVVWTRILSLLFGATTYTFSLILAVFLVGLGIGSTIGSELARRIAQPRIVLGWCQLLLCATIAWAAMPRVRRSRTGRSTRSLSTNSDLQLPARSDARHLGAAAVDAAVGREFPAGACRRGACPARIRGGSSAASTPPTPLAPSSARSSPGCCSSAPSAARSTQQILIGIAATSGVLVLVGLSPADQTEGCSARGPPRSLVAGACIAAVAPRAGGAAAARIARRVRPLRGDVGRYQPDRLCR